MWNSLPVPFSLVQHDFRRLQSLGKCGTLMGLLNGASGSRWHRACLPAAVMERDSRAPAARRGFWRAELAGQRGIMMNTTARLSFWEKAGYSLGDGSANLVFQMMMMFQLFFYTDVFGIGATAAGMILLVARVFDAFVDPLAGILSDRTQTRWGKFRPWVLWTAIPFAVFFMLAFATPDLGARGKVLWAGITYTLLMAVYSFNNTPYSSLGGVMTGDVRERTGLASARFVTATVATFVVQGLTLPLVAKFGQGDARLGWHWAIGIFAAVAAVLLVITFLTTKERIEPPKGQRSSIRQDFADLVRNKSWKAMFVLTLFLFTTLALWGSSMSYFFNYVVDKAALAAFLQHFGLVAQPGAAAGWGAAVLNAFGLIVHNDGQVFAVGFSLFNMAGQIVTLLGVIFLSQRLADRFGKRDTFIACLGLTALSTALFYFVPADAIGTMFAINLLKSIAYAPTIPLLWAMMGDVADHSEWVNRRRATGFTFAGIVFALKAGLGLGGALCGAIIERFGFVANAAQTASASLGIRLTSSLIPAATFFVGVVVLFFYPLTKQLMQTIQSELEARRS
jgi:GPH family glycoside/pentoside/hexuronide:cation symporter